MKIALDPYMFRSTPLLEFPALVADLGFEHIELSPCEDFMPFVTHPPADIATVTAFKDALGAAAVSVSSVLPLYRWAGPDEDERQAAVRYWRRAIEITVEFGCSVMNSEFRSTSTSTSVRARSTGTPSSPPWTASAPTAS